MGYHHLTIEERGLIAQYHRSGLSLRTIATLLERSPATISRELRRNRSSLGIATASTFPFKRIVWRKNDEKAVIADA